MKNRICFILVAVLTMGNQCAEVDVTDQRVADTMVDLNNYWRKGYGTMLDEIGTRHYRINRSKAYSGMEKVMSNLGFTLTMSEGDYYMSVTIPADQMFSDQEWQQVREKEEPQMREIASRHLGIKGNFASLEPTGLLINGKITLLETEDGTDITLTFQLNEIEPQPPESILPRREYPPPYAARMGYEKIWRRFEELTLPMVGLSGSE